MPRARARRTFVARCAIVLAVFAAAWIAVVASSVAASGRGAEQPVVETRLTASQLRARLRTTAWMPSWDLDRSRASLRDHQRLVGRLSPLWFELRADGRMVVRRAGAFDPEVLSIVRARRIALVPTVTNDLDRARVHVLLASATTRRRHVDQLVALAVRSRFAGIGIDYEDVDPADRVVFTSLLQELGRRLRARGMVLAVDVPAATSSAADAVGENAYDLAAIGAAADEVRVLAYDYSTPCSGSGPVAPITWVRQVVAHTVELVPRRKVVLGVPLYGYDWPRTGCADSRTWQDTDALRRDHAGTLGWSNPFQSRQLRYAVDGARHLVWYEDARATAAKLRLAREEHLRGVALWRIGGEDPRTWAMLDQVLGAPAT
ncbi:MAG: ydhD [Thermoleophilia bacterium]|nr:ydhD [Thermoleophilia bacterium]